MPTPTPKPHCLWLRIVLSRVVLPREAGSTILSSVVTLHIVRILSFGLFTLIHLRCCMLLLLLLWLLLLAFLLLPLLLLLLLLRSLIPVIISGMSALPGLSTREISSRRKVSGVSLMSAYPSPPPTTLSVSSSRAMLFRGLVNPSLCTSASADGFVYLVVFTLESFMGLTGFYVFLKKALFPS